MKKSISILATIALVIATGCEQEINDLKPKEPILVNRWVSSWGTF
jgi:hypothetical protein